MQRYFAKDRIDDCLTLIDDDIRHIKTVMRMKDNDEIIVVYKNIPYLCFIDNINEDIKINIKETLQIIEETIPKVTLIVPILKEQKMDFILQKATEMGVYKIIPFYSERGLIKEKKEKENKKLERWKRIVKEASEQSHRNGIPEITNISSFDELKKIDGINVICSTVEKTTNIKNLLKRITKCDRINLVMGPEGGLSENEETALLRNEFIPVTFGSRIFRVETVPLFIMSIVNYEFME